MHQVRDRGVRHGYTGIVVPPLNRFPISMRQGLPDAGCYCTIAIMKKPQSIDEHLLKIIDSLIFQSKKQEAWISALTEKVVFFESTSIGKPVKDAQRDLSKRQKFYLQKLMEKIEDKNPGLAAKLDQRSDRDL